jgi:ribosomal protein S18 acetylase RimI-like enzyme
MPDELERAWAFLLRGDMGAGRTEESSVGTALYDDEVPLRLDSNLLLVERPADTEEVLAEAQRLSRRLILFRDPDDGERVAPQLAEQGWRISRVTIMAQLREPELRADTSLVTEVREEDLRDARAQLNAGRPWGAPEIMAQLFAGKRGIAERVGARFFAVEVGGEVVSYSDLYGDGPDAQVEDVGTLPEHRGRGHAKAVVMRAIEEARAAGAEFVFLVADREDWPKELYRRLGFDEVGYYVRAISPSV